MKKIFVIAALGLFSIGTTNAQEQFKCGLNQKLAKMYAENPQLQIDHENLLRNGMKTVEKDGVKQTIFTIPIVFHIIHSYGSENISDAQVRNQVDILNRDYRLMNADTSVVVPSFKQLYGDVGIEFKLATIDPYGNCTNGIEHIYSHEYTQGDDYSKLNQWYRDRYLNVWVVASMRDGVAGYAFYPTDTEGSNFFRDGIIILNQYIGSIGTGNAYNSRALTHEVGHYLGLSHPWGSTNEPGVACGDDGIADTPITKGSNLACNLSMAVCTAGVIENVQNYMDYSYCSRMFTLDQVSAMRNIIQGDAGKRNNLIKPENHVLTGIDLTSPPPCKPIAEFYTAERWVCPGTNITIKDFSYNLSGPITSRQWIFEDGTSTTTTDSIATVSFNSSGFKDVTLIVTTIGGTDTIVMNDYINVFDSWANFTGPTSLDLNDDKVYWFRVVNPEENYAKFRVSADGGFNNSRCYVLQNYRNVSNALPYSEAYFYNNRIGGNKDFLITPSYDLRSTTTPNFSFKYAYASNATTTADITEKLNVYASLDCGKTWSLRKTITGAELITSGYAGGADFKPTSNNAWKTATLTNIGSTVNADKIRFVFEFVTTDNSSNFYLDDINVGGVLGLVTNEAENLDVTVYPNPTNGEELNITYTSLDSKVEFTLRDAQGKAVANEVKNETNQTVNFKMNTNGKLASGCYFLEIKTGDFSTTKKIVVM